MLDALIWMADDVWIFTDLADDSGYRMGISVIRYHQLNQRPIHTSSAIRISASSISASSISASSISASKSALSEAPSPLGCVQKHLEEAGQALEPGFHQARRAVVQAEFVGLDETGWRLGQLPYWIWVAEAEQAAIFLVREGRTKQVAQELVGEPKERIFTTDRYAAYGFLPAAARQICHAHLLREFRQMAQRDGPIGSIGAQLEWLCAGCRLRACSITSPRPSKAFGMVDQRLSLSSAKPHTTDDPLNAY
jgi:hypothetical protein